MTSPINILLVGCGLMGKRHIHGLWELSRAGTHNVQLVGVVDKVPERAAEAAETAERLLSRRPAGFGSLQDALEALDVDVVDICTDVSTHHTVAREALERGIHCLIEKPLAATVRACRLVIEAARRGGAKLGVAENYRRDPSNRLAKWIIEKGIFGHVLDFLQVQLGGGDAVLLSSWRHSKAGGILLDLCCHYTDIINYYLGEPEWVYGFSSRLRRIRYSRENVGGELVKRPLEVEAEDFLDATFAYRGGCVAKLYVNLSSAGAGLYHKSVHFEDGSMIVPQERTGGPVMTSRPTDRDYLGLTTMGVFLGVRPAEPYRLAERDVAEVYDRYTLRLFPGLLNGYSLSFQEADRKLIALEMLDFLDAVLTGGKPETGGVEGLLSVAMIMAALESSVAGRRVTLREVLDLKIEEYQGQINRQLGIASDI
jgi:predicted dehydrogenase